MKTNKVSNLELKKIFKGSIKTSLVVGTLLSFVNQNSCLYSLNFTRSDLIKMFFNYLIPFSVSFYSRISIINDLNK